MKYEITLHDYKGRSTAVQVASDIVDSLYLVIRYTVSGDEVYLFVTDNGEVHGYDANDYIEDTPDRLISCGPEDIQVIFPDNMKWNQVYDA